MNIKTFRIAILCVCIIIIIILCGIFFVYKPSGSCPAQTCPITTCPVVKCPITTQIVQKEVVNEAQVRDRRVLNDPLYPSLNRTDTQTFNAVTREVRNGNLYQNQRGSGDEFRIVGYLSNNQEKRDSGGNQWKLFARMRDNNQGEFYIIPVNNNYDMKIPLTTEVIVGERLRDVYSIPNELRFKSSLLNDGVYEFVELPKTDFNSPQYL